ncbi:MAG: hydantoinase/oxoprolinase family protein [Gammaproteobacteria bacterium]|jgi:N-methylhydantoinase A
MNAFVGPTVRDYITRLDATLDDAGLRADLHVMRSNRGVAAPRQVSVYPVQTLLSGPAAGVLGGAFTGGSAGRDKLITFDVGGTSADISVITDGAYAQATARDTRVAGFPLLVPMIDIHTIGTRGGSIARMDAAGGLSVGPDSAGAVPGPAAYGNGGRKRTLTDANLVLGRLDPENFLGGEMSLDIATAQAVIGELAAHIGLDPLRTAEGVVAVANNDMANAIHARTVQKDLDVRDYALVAFGDGGPLHAAEVARLIGIPEVIMPICPGINSALGLLTTDLSYDAVRTQFQSSTAIDTPGLSAAFDDMHATLGDQFAADGLDVRDVAFRRADDLRYVGQGYELRVAFSGGEFSDTALAEIFRNFHRQHEDEYGHAFPDNPIEIVNVRLTGTGSVPKLERLPPPPAGDIDAAFVRSDKTLFRIGTALGEHETRFYRRDRLPSGSTFSGPASGYDNARAAGLRRLRRSGRESDPVG